MILSKEEIEKAKGWLSALDIKSEFEAILKETLLQYIEQLEISNKELDRENNRLEKIELERDKANKIIDLMAKSIYLEMPVGFYHERKIKEQTTTGLRQYFEKKVKRG